MKSQYTINRIYYIFGIPWVMALEEKGDRYTVLIDTLQDFIELLRMEAVMEDDPEFLIWQALHAIETDDKEAAHQLLSDVCRICRKRLLPSGMEYPRWGNDHEPICIGDRFEVSGKEKTVSEISFVEGDVIIADDEDTIALCSDGYDLARHVIKEDR